MRSGACDPEYPTATPLISRRIGADTGMFLDTARSGLGVRLFRWLLCCCRQSAATCVKPTVGLRRGHVTTCYDAGIDTCKKIGSNLEQATRRGARLSESIRGKTP